MGRPRYNPEDHRGHGPTARSNLILRPEAISKGKGLSFERPSQSGAGGGKAYNQRCLLIRRGSDQSLLPIEICLLAIVSFRLIQIHCIAQFLLAFLIRIHCLKPNPDMDHQISLEFAEHAGTMRSQSMNTFLLFLPLRISQAKIE